MLNNSESSLFDPKTSKRYHERDVAPVKTTTKATLAIYQQAYIQITVNGK